MKKKDYEKELQELEKKYRWRINLAWVVVVGIMVWVASVIL